MTRTAYTDLYVHISHLFNKLFPQKKDYWLQLRNTLYILYKIRSTKHSKNQLYSQDTNFSFTCSMTFKQTPYRYFPSYIRILMSVMFQNLSYGVLTSLKAFAISASSYVNIAKRSSPYPYFLFRRIDFYIIHIGE